MTLETTPDTIIAKRKLDAPPERVFHAWADEEERRQWDVPGDDWVIESYSSDFREDGIETSRFGPAGDPVAESFGRYLLIEPPRRIVNAGVMRSARTGEVSSATMMTLQFESDGDGTQLTLIDQSVYLGEGETAEMREQGWGKILDKLTAYIAENRKTPA
tara:strand:+ start:5843 stop:6322 length:480 start_codon:yes stop_codon:yes gene_type:complete